MGGNLKAVEIKAFVPAKDFELAKRFYVDLGFTCAWSDAALAYFHHGTCGFLLQNFHVEAHASNFMMHVQVEDVGAWRAQVEASGVIGKYGVMATAVESQPWGMRDFVFTDPTGVLWRVGQNLD